VSLHQQQNNTNPTAKTPTKSTQQKQRKAHSKKQHLSNTKPNKANTDTRKTTMSVLQGKQQCCHEKTKTKLPQERNANQEKQNNHTVARKTTKLLHQQN